MYKGLSWDDMCLVHAIVETGTLSGASRVLGVSHPTVFRKLNTLEEKMDVLFFNRARNGYSATAAAEEVRDLYVKLQDEVNMVERRIAGRDLRPSGTVRITTTDSLLYGWLTPVLAEFHKAYTDITLEVVVSNDVLNLTKREADIALRPISAPTGALSSKRVGTISQAVYGARFDAEQLNWIGPDDSIFYPVLQHWMEKTGHDSSCVYRTNSVLDMYVAVKSGIGKSVLPCYLGDSSSDLVKHGQDISELATDLWLITHPDLRKAERVRVLFEHIATSALAFP
ncbi:LysR family transcriptional regulator [Amylibacter sp. SFDW26]|uniref:LysR family transcriptional regulator n=1 Tax=Amylibacter sp. SFDW26 TaxID=2652722 RepID=UPI0012624712|nr:LysR family transcriptional regulator [Amylibacter sp. SFDW26]KAB7615456.1 LysR family transcriptional regulator [Amylibacter sp. SFDW26]